jgi:C-terminal processing protease CtpA/Prc
MFRALALCAIVVCSACRKQIVTAFPDEFVGVGVELTMQGESASVVRTIEGGPAQHGGLLANDRLIAIDEISIVGMGLPDIVLRLRGQPGSTVDVTLMRGSQRMHTQLVRHSIQKTGDGYAPAMQANR